MAAASNYQIFVNATLDPRRTKEDKSLLSSEFFFDFTAMSTVENAAKVTARSSACISRSMSRKTFHRPCHSLVSEEFGASLVSEMLADVNVPFSLDGELRWGRPDKPTFELKCQGDIINRILDAARSVGHANDSDGARKVFAVVVNIWRKETVSEIEFEALSRLQHAKKQRQEDEREGQHNPSSKSLAEELGMQEFAKHAEVICTVIRPGKSHSLLKRIEKGEQQCPVCLEELKVGGIAVALPCTHTYHCRCILGWFMHKSFKSKGFCTCPTCRFRLAWGS